MQTSNVSPPRRTIANACVFRTREGSINVARSAFIIQTAIHEECSSLFRPNGVVNSGHALGEVRPVRRTLRCRTPHAGQGTFPANINAGGAIIGDYVDANIVLHGFARSSHSGIKTFDAPGAGTTAGLGTTPTCNNAGNAITGWYSDPNGIFHGFLRLPDR
jgi:hypothetical protein